MRLASAILVGDRAGDPHVDAVASLLPRNGLVVIHAHRLRDVVRHFEPGRTTLIDENGDPVSLGEYSPGRGWIRRLAPAGWDRGVILGSHQAAVLSARFALLGALLRDPAVEWLTRVDDLFAAESKPVQYRAAAAFGIRVPRTIVGAHAEYLADELGDSFVMKPLGPGNFDSGGDQHVVHARRLTFAEIADVDLLDAPFLAQSAIDARVHLRVVTVKQQTWVCELDAVDLPLDWRETPSAHHSFTASNRWPEVELAALALTESLGVGFSSQDWVVDDEGPAFLDLNPGGQWLFLPEPVNSAIAKALAGWLAGQ